MSTGYPSMKKEQVKAYHILMNSVTAEPEWAVSFIRLDMYIIF